MCFTRPMHSQAPVIETDRLRLRPFTAADAPAMRALWQDEAAQRFLMGRPASDEEIWQRLLRYAGLWPLLGYGYWLIEEKATGAYAGDAGLADFRRPFAWPVQDAPELGYALIPAMQGRGYAREAVSALLAWSDRELRSPLVAFTQSEHIRSLRLAQAMGFETAGTAEYGGNQVSLLLRPDPS